MKRKLLVLALCLALLCAPALAGMLACACAEEAEPRRGAYIQWDENGYTAVYAPDGTLLYPAGRYEARRSGDGLIHIQGDRGAGVLDAAGNILVKPEWGWTDDYSDGRICVFWGGKAGALDEQGVEVVGLDWDCIYSFHNGFAHVRLDRKSGVINRSGRVVVALVWDRIDNDTEDNAFCEGVVLRARMARSSSSAWRPGRRSPALTTAPAGARLASTTAWLWSAPMGVQTAIRDLSTAPAGL